MDSNGSERDLDSCQSYTQSEASSDDALEAGIIDFKRDIQIIESLKFQNTIYKPGQHISLRTEPKSPKQIYAQIMLIAQAPQTQFPLILVAWHYSKFDGFDKDSIPPYLSNKQLIASSHKDWQYVESIKSKITVMTLEQYENLDYKERQKPNIFFMRSRLDYQSNLPIPQPSLVCHCLKPYNPDEKITECCICSFQFHVVCAKHQYLCINCQ